MFERNRGLSLGVCSALLLLFLAAPSFGDDNDVFRRSEHVRQSIEQLLRTDQFDELADLLRSSDLAVEDRDELVEFLDQMFFDKDFKGTDRVVNFLETALIISSDTSIKTTFQMGHRWLVKRPEFWAWIRQLRARRMDYELSRVLSAALPLSSYDITFNSMMDIVAILDLGGGGDSGKLLHVFAEGIKRARGNLEWNESAQHWYENLVQKAIERCIYVGQHFGNSVLAPPAMLSLELGVLSLIEAAPSDLHDEWIELMLVRNPSTRWLARGARMQPIDELASRMQETSLSALRKRLRETVSQGSLGLLVAHHDGSLLEIQRILQIREPVSDAEFLEAAVADLGEAYTLLDNRALSSRSVMYLYDSTRDERRRALDRATEMLRYRLNCELKLI